MSALQLTVLLNSNVIQLINLNRPEGSINAFLTSIDLIKSPKYSWERLHSRSTSKPPSVRTPSVFSHPSLHRCKTATLGRPDLNNVTLRGLFKSLPTTFPPISQMLPVCVKDLLLFTYLFFCSNLEECTGHTILQIQGQLLGHWFPWCFKGIKT